jgi:hypothetical protein
MKAMFEIPILPESPPELDQEIEVDIDQVRKAQTVLAGLCSSLENLPVILSQEGKVITQAGAQDDVVAERLAKTAARVWREGSNRLSRELVRFEEEVIDEVDSRANFLIYSAHITGGITLTVGWQLTLSLTQVRAEVGDVRAELVKIIGAKGKP